jgi:hypothetical protein
MKILFLDESGDHNLAVIDPQHPLFVLGGIIVEEDYYEEIIHQSVLNFKKELFGDESIILHTADITRNRNGFERMKEPEFRKYFYYRINRLMISLDYTVIACAIKKENLLKYFNFKITDPYFLSLDKLINIFCSTLNVYEKGFVIAESRQPILDKELISAWSNLSINKTNRIIDLTIKSKKENISGLQLADLVVSPIARKLLGKPVKNDFKIIELKLRKNINGEYWENGLIIFPKEVKVSPATQLLTS